MEKNLCTPDFLEKFSQSPTACNNLKCIEKALDQLEAWTNWKIASNALPLSFNVVFLQFFTLDLLISNGQLFLIFFDSALNGYVTTEILTKGSCKRRVNFQLYCTDYNRYDNIIF